MANKTIYVSDKDEPIFDQAQAIGGEALSAVIARALREYVARNQSKAKGMKEVAVKIGSRKMEREQRFIGQHLGRWRGMSDDKRTFVAAHVYRTAKDNLAIHIVALGHPWRGSHDHWDWSDLVDQSRGSELIIGSSIEQLQGKLPAALLRYIEDVIAKDEQPVEYLDI